MIKCINCGKNIMLSFGFDNAPLCKKCASLIYVSSWKKRDFSTIEKLSEEKNNAIIMAKQNGFSDDLVKRIESYFSEYESLGYSTTINGKAGQKLKIFSDFVIIDTKSELSKSSIINTFSDFIDDEESYDSLISTDHKKNLIRGLTNGNIVKTGVSAVASMIIDSKEKEKITEKKRRVLDNALNKLVTVGERRILLKNISRIDTYSAPDTTNGYLRFIPIDVSINDYYSCEYFFFNNSIPFESKKIKQEVYRICDLLNNKIEIQNMDTAPFTKKTSNDKQDQKSSEQSFQNHDIFNELRKFKELFDEGILTEAEFTAKKKELLNLK